MTRDELLTKLARELPQWPAGLNKEQLVKLIAPIFMPPFSGLYYGCDYDRPKAEAYLCLWNITRADYLAECDRLGVTAPAHIPEPMPGPVKSAWDGEGLPPAGETCKAVYTDMDQGLVTVRYMGSEACVLLSHEHGEEQCGLIEDYEFTSLRSEEDRAVEEMLAEAGHGTVIAESVRKSICRRHYRAGYRKTGGGA